VDPPSESTDFSSKQKGANAKSTKKRKADGAATAASKKRLVSADNSVPIELRLLQGVLDDGNEDDGNGRVLSGILDVDSIFQLDKERDKKRVSRI
jgi:hypothetical protein